MKKFFAIALAAVVALSSTAVAFAAADDYDDADYGYDEPVIGEAESEYEIIDCNVYTQFWLSEFYFDDWNGVYSLSISYGFDFDLTVKNLSTGETIYGTAEHGYYDYYLDCEIYNLPESGYVDADLHVYVGDTELTMPVQIYVEADVDYHPVDEYDFVSKTEPITLVPGKDFDYRFTGLYSGAEVKLFRDMSDVPVTLTNVRTGEDVVFTNENADIEYCREFELFNMFDAFKNGIMPLSGLITSEDGTEISFNYTCHIDWSGVGPDESKTEYGDASADTPTTDKDGEDTDAADNNTTGADTTDNGKSTTGASGSGTAATGNSAKATSDSASKTGNAAASNGGNGAVQTGAAATAAIALSTLLAATGALYIFYRKRNIG